MIASQSCKKILKIFAVKLLKSCDYFKISLSCKVWAILMQSCYKDQDSMSQKLFGMTKETSSTKRDPRSVHKTVDEIPVNRSSNFGKWFTFWMEFHYDAILNFFLYWLKCNSYSLSKTVTGKLNIEINNCFECKY